MVVSDGTLVGVEPDTPPVVTLEPEPQSEEEKADSVQANVQVVDCEQEVREQSLVPEKESSVSG